MLVIGNVSQILKTSYLRPDAWLKELRYVFGHTPRLTMWR